MRVPVLVAAFLLLLAGPAWSLGEYGERRREIEVRFAEQLMEIAKQAKRFRGADLARAAFERAEELDPGNDDVISFDPEVVEKAGGSQRRRLTQIEKRYRALLLEEGKARLELAVWCDEEAFVDELVEEARTALTIAPGPISFAADGTLSGKHLGDVPLTISIALLEEHEVFESRLVALDDLPDDIPWSRGWKLATKHFRIETNVSGRICRTLAQALQAAREIYREETGFVVTKTITVYVLAKRESYEAWLVKAGEPKPHPSNTGKCIRDTCAVDGSKSRKEIVSTTIHEVAHGYFHLGHEALTGQRGVNMPTWYAEGLATYCAGYGPDSLSYDDGLVLPELGRDGPLKRFQTFLKLRQARPLHEFMSMEQGDARFYYQACAFFWFFHETGDEDLKQAFKSAAQAMKKAALPPEERNPRGNRIFAEKIGVDLAELERRFFDWVRSRTTRSGPAPLRTR